MTTERVERRLAAILSVDVVGYSSLMRADEKGTLARLQAHRREFLDPKTAEHNGRIVKLMGDGALIEFASVVDAVECAVELQRGMADRNANTPEDQRIEFRIGINLGDIIVEGDDIYGDGVNVAARLEQLSDAGGVIISGTAFDQAKNKVDVGFEDLGPQTVKNIPEPVRAYRVLLDPAVAGTVVEHANAKRDQPKRTRWMIAGAAAAVVVIGVAVGVVFALEPWVERVEAAIEADMDFPLPAEPSIVILPFENVGGDREQDWFADAVTGDIVTHLGQLPGMFVIDRNTSFAYRGRPVTVKQAAEELGVRYVLGGSVQRSGEELRIATQLTDALSGRILWSERYDRSAEDLFALQDEITRNVSEALDMEFYARGQRSGSGDNLAAWEFSAQATAHLVRVTKEDMAKAQSLWQKAIEIGGEQPYFMTGIAWTHFLGAADGFTDDPMASSMKAVEANQRALELDPNWAESHSLLAFFALYHHRKYDEAIAHAEKAVSLAPNNAQQLAHLTSVYARSGHYEDALATFEKTVRLSPYYPPWYLIGVQVAYGGLGRWEDLLKVSQLYEEREPESGMPYVGMTQALWELGRKEEAQASLQRLLEFLPHFNLDEVRTWGHKHTEKAAAFWRQMGIPEHPPLPLPDKPSIAVLPFNNLSDDPAQEYFVDGMTETLITDLSRIPELFVIARNTSFTYKGKAVDAKSVGRELGVRYILEGSVQRADRRVRINAQLIDALTGGHLWAERYDGRLSDVFALQDRVTGKIVEALAVSLTPNEHALTAGAQTSSQEAYDAFLRGWAYYRQSTPRDVTEAIPHFERAIALDPDYGHAYAALASIYWIASEERDRGIWLTALALPYQDARRLNDEYLEKALRRPTPLAHQVASSMRLREGRFEEALAEARQAIDLDPNDPIGHEALAKALIYAGAPVEGENAIRAAMRVDPLLSSEYLTWLGLAQIGREQYAAAAETLRDAISKNPDNDQALGLIISALGHLGHLDEARFHLERLNRYRESYQTHLTETGSDLNVGIDTLLLGPFTLAETNIWLFRKPDDRDRVREGLRLAGVPETAEAGVSPRSVPGAVTVDAAKAKGLHGQGAAFVDTRSPGLWDLGRIPGAVLLDLTSDFTEEALADLIGRDDPVVIYCAGPKCLRSSEACARAVGWGFTNVYYFRDGFPSWKAEGHPVELN